MSHHLDTPLARENGRLYIDDLYVFPGDRGTVFVMDVNSSVGGKDIQQGFHPEARYEFKVHFDGAEFETLTYRISFGDMDANGQQTLQLYALSGAEASQDAATGELILQGRTGEMSTDNGTRIWAGRIADPFFIDLDQLAVIDAAVKNGSTVDQQAWRPENAKNSFAGTTVQSIVLEVSEHHPMLHIGANIGVWCATKLATDAGGWRPINRAGHPMMWPIFWPNDVKFTNPANTRHPSQDLSDDGDWLAGMVANVVRANGTSDDPQGYSQIVTRQLFPDVMSYVVGTPANFGFATRNGRTMYDNAAEAMFSMILNKGTDSGLTPAINERTRDPKFPYVVTA